MNSAKKFLDPREGGKTSDDQSNNGSLFGTGFIVDPMEAERIIENLKLFTVEQVGTSEWMQQHEKLEKLNLQAHHSAINHSDEFILESILTFSKIEFLIHDLLVIEIWKEFVFPKLINPLSARNSMRLYFILYHEATIINLLEIFLYHKHVCEAGGEKLIELIDYVVRKVTKLNGGYDFRGMDSFDNTISEIKSNLKDTKEFTDSLVTHSPVEELMKHFKEIEFRICISAISIGRFLCEHSDNLPLSVISRICDTHDYLMLIIPLVENPPWTRRLTTGKWQKLIDFRWQEVPPIDLLKITKLEGQIWITYYYLLAKQIFRERYHINTFRKGQILRLRKYLNEILLDQLPFLVDIQRYLDELTIMETSSDPGGTNGSVFLLQQVSVFREKLIQNKNWELISETQITEVFTMEDRNDSDLRSLAGLYSDDFVEEIMEPQPKRNESGQVEEEYDEISSQLRS